MVISQDAIVYDPEFKSLVLRINTARYGAENCAELFHEIISIDDENMRKEKIHKLLGILGKNKEENSFFNHNDRIPGESGIESKLWFKLNSLLPYYTFFALCHDEAKAHPQKNLNEIVFDCAKATVDGFFGPFNGDIEKLQNLLTPKSGDVYNPDIKDVTSIELLKNKNCAICAQRASLSHNLWIMAGYECTYIASDTADLGNSHEHGHAFCIVTTGKDKYLLFDPSLDIYKKIESQTHPRDDIMLNKKPLVFEANGEKYVYANAQALEQKDEQTR